MLFCVALFSCTVPKSPHQKEIDLIKQFASVQKTSDTRFIIFGTKDGRKSLLTGWSDDEKNQGTTYQWAIEPKASFAFNIDHPGTYYLHLRMKSFFNNPTQVFVNAKPAGSFTVDQDTEYYTVALPADAIRSGANVIELQFSELQPSPRPSDTRSLAAAAYYAAISPGKYMLENLPNPLPEPWEVGQLRVLDKNVPIADSKTGGALSTFQRLDSNSRIRFGYFYRPSNFAENDDFAEFSVFLRKDGEPEKRIFVKRLVDKTLQYQTISLGDIVKSPDIYQIRFCIGRNSVFDDGQTAWLQPTVVVEAQSPKVIAEDPRVDALRHANQGANVVIMLLDAGGAKHFSSYGYPEPTTPNADAVGRDGIKFDNAYCQAVYTLASTASLMSGQLPIHHRIIYTKNRLSSDIFTMAESFRSAGYSTGTFLANGNASDIFGMAQGFQEIADVFRYRDYTGWGQDITNAFEKWLPEAANKRFFAYLHYREPHAPYNPPEQWKFKFVDPNYKGNIIDSYEVRKQINYGQLQASQGDKDFIQAMYDANLNYGDYQIGQVVQRLKQLGIYDQTIVIIIADHGEAFWEHGYQGHNSQLYQESIHIPMLIKLARGSQIAKTSPSFVRTIDIYPTLIDLLGFSRKGMRVDGRSFVPYFVSAPADDRDVVSQVIMERQYAFMEGSYKYMVDLNSHVEELYNLKADPGEKKNLVNIEPVRAGYYQSQLFDLLASKKNVGAYFQNAEKATIDEATKENIEALGYVGEDANSGPQRQQSNDQD